jgi:adenosine deaminase
MHSLKKVLATTISETNGIALLPTLDLIINSPRVSAAVKDSVSEFAVLLRKLHENEISVEKLLFHPVSECLRGFFKNFPLPFMEEHIHLTGSLSAEFVYPRLKKLLEGAEGDQYRKKILEEYGQSAKFSTLEEVRDLITLKNHERFARYLKILYLPKLVLIDRKAHRDAAYHIAKTLYETYNVGFIRLKFTYDRSTSSESERVIGSENLHSEEVVLGLYEGFSDYQKENSKFTFTLSPSFRKEADFFDAKNFKDKKAHFDSQVQSIIDLLDNYSFLAPVLTDVDTVGDETGLFRKEHFNLMVEGFRKLQARGIRIRSHHGETFQTLRHGIQAVDNAMNIWRIDTLEHGLSLGINPNFYFQTVLEESLKLNREGTPIDPKSFIYRELRDMNWFDSAFILEKLLKGIRCSETEMKEIIKVKFHHAQSVETYQHDVLNRLLNKDVTVTALPSSNQKLTGVIPGFQDHPFSWWEKKGVKLGVGTDNYVTLGTDYIQEMLLLLYSEPHDLKITKLLMVTTGESRRMYLSRLLWDTRKRYEDLKVK